MNVSISIVNWNTSEMLKKCLSAIYKSIYKDFEVFVIDNASKDGSTEMVRNIFPEAKLIANNQNLGFGKANNQAIKISSGKYILILNPDVIVFENTIKLMIDFMDSNSNAGAIGINLLNESGIETKSGYFRKFPSIPQILFFYTMLENMSSKINWLKNRYWEPIKMSKIMEIDQIPGACLMIRKEVIKEIGMFDERFNLFFEDVDICYRIKKTKWKLFYLPDIKAIHIGAHSINKLSYTELATKFFNSMYLFIEKHHSRLKAKIAKIIIESNTLLKILVLQLLCCLSNYKKEKRTEHIHMLWQFVKPKTN